MCGILGSINIKFNQETLNLISHRCPDSSGINDFDINDNKIKFAQTRLAIVDLSEAGHQPMISNCGNYAMIASNVSILNSTHKFDRIDIPMIQQGSEINNNPIIEDDIWLGRNVVMLPCVKVGKGSIVAASAVVIKDVEPYSIIGGVPAKLIKNRK